MKKIVLYLLIVILHQVSWAGSPIGHWQTVDDQAGKVEAVVEIWEEGGKIHGKIIELFNLDEPNPLCDQCKGDKKNKPVNGMTILWGLAQSADGWEDG